MEIQASRPRALDNHPDDGSRLNVAPRAGKIEVSAQAIATIAGRAVEEVYGVVGIAARHPRFGGVELLRPDQYRRGVGVRFVDDHVAIEVDVVVEYGLRISEVARNLIKDVKYAVEQALGLPVVEVNVNVQGLRVNGRIE